MNDVRINYLIPIVSALLLNSTIGLGQVDERQIHAIDTTASTKESFAFFANEIANARVVALGEQTHDPDASFAMRARLVEYLIEYHDFEVVLFEAGMFDLHEANKLVLETQSIDSLKGGLYRFWSQPREHEKMFNYFQSVIDRGQKLTFGGFDCKLTSPYGRTQGKYVTALKQQLNAANAEFFADKYQTYLDYWEAIEADLQGGGIKSFSFRMEAAEKNAFLSLSRFFQEKLRAAGDSYWAQMIHTVDQSVVLYSDFRLTKAIFNKVSLLGLNNKRDSLMAENLDYLLHDVYEGKKVILIGATYHFARNVSQMQPGKVSGLDLSKSVTMGEIMSESTGEEIFVVGFTAPSRKKCKAKGNGNHQSLPCIQQGLGYDIAYFPLHQWPLSEPDLNKQLVVPILHPKSETRHPDWNGVLDAVVFINKPQ